MKRPFLFLLFLCLCFSLFAQTYSPAVSLYVPEVSGTGKDSDDNAFIAYLLILELVGRNYSIMGKQSEADYSMIGTIAPLHNKNTREDDTSTDLYVFNLKLVDNAAKIDLIELSLVYRDREELSPLITAMVSGIFSSITIEHGNRYAWRNKRWYFGAAAFWTPRVYIGTSRSTNILNFGFGASAEFNFFNYLAVESGLEIAPDWISATNRTGDSYREMMLEIPFSVKVPLKLGAYYLIEPYAGIHFNIPLSGTIKPPVLSWQAGLQYGIKAGPGILFVDPRFSMDFGKSALVRRPAGWLEYDRYTIYIGVGYKYGIQKRLWQPRKPPSQKPAGQPVEAKPREQAAKNVSRETFY